MLLPHVRRGQASRYSVARAMKISFAAATHRFTAWRKAGGEKRVRALMG